MHKPKLGARLIAAGTRWITNPLSLLVAKFLQPLVRVTDTVAQDTQCVIDALKDAPITADSKLATFDVEQLYPSMDQVQVLGATRLALTEYYSRFPERNWGAKVELVIMLLQIIFDGQILRMVACSTGDKRFYLQQVGITTGLSCAVQLANVYLTGLDKAFTYAFGASVLVYRRFVDDILVLLDSRIDTSDLLAVLNAFHANIAVTNEDEDDKSVTFLDLCISIFGSLSYSTHRKALAAYAYTPFDSCHAYSTLLGIVATEAVRLLRTNLYQVDYEAQLCFFMGKLKLRGYDIVMVRKVIKKYPWSRKQDLVSSRSGRSAKIFVPLKIPYSPKLPLLHANRIFKAHEAILSLEMQAILKPMVALQTAPNLFRLRYSRFS